jgi:predicted esterase
MPLEQKHLDGLVSSDPAQRKQAIIEVSRASNPDALKWLAEIYRHDPEPELRELALKAGRHIKATSTPQPPVVDMPSATPTTSVSIEDSREKWLYDRAMDYLVMGDRVKAAGELRKLLARNPNLGSNSSVLLLAGQITGQPPEQAVESLMDAKQHRQFVSNQTRTQRRSSSRGPLRWISLLLALVALGVAIFFFIDSGALQRYQLADRMNRLEENARQVHGITYYVLVPPGDPPARGWPALVVMHGYGGRGRDMLLPFVDFAEREGVLLIAPSFGQYPFPYDELTLPVLNAILRDVDQQTPLHDLGAVFYGFSAGGEIATLFAGRYSSQVAGITAEGAPEIHQPPRDRGLPYNILYGEKDELRNFTSPSVDNLRNLGYPVLYEVIAGVGHEMTARGVGLAMDMVRTTY